MVVMMKVSRADTGRGNRKWGFGIFFLSLLLSFCFQLSHLLWQCFPLTKRHLGSCQNSSPVIQGFRLGKDFIVFVITTLAHFLICELYLYTSKDVFLCFVFFLGWQHLWTWQSWCHVCHLHQRNGKWQTSLLLRLLINSNAFCILEQICWLWDQNARGVKVAKSQSRWPGCQDKNPFSFTKYSFILYRSPWALRVCAHTFQKKDKL